MNNLHISSLDDLLLSKRAKTLLNSFISRTPHAVLILGAPHMGKATISRYLSSTLLNIELSRLDLNPYYIVINKEGSENKKSISISQIKSLQKDLLLKSIGTNKTKRVVSIQSIDDLTIEASNALLKTLEEPPEDTVFILTASSKENILPTIVSRTSLVELETPSLHAVKEFFANYDSSSVEKAYFRSSGATGSIKDSLVSKNTNEDEAIELAKKLLTVPLFDKLIMVEYLAKNKELLSATIECLEQLLLIVIRKQTSSKSTKQLALKAEAVSQASTEIKMHVSPKLLLTNLMYKL